MNRRRLEIYHSNYKEDDVKDSEKFKAYQRLFNTNDGKIVLDDLKRISGLENALYDKDANRLYYLEGRRSIVCDIKEVVELSNDRMNQLLEAEKQEEAKGANNDGYNPNQH